MRKTTYLFLLSILFFSNLAQADQKPYIISGFDDVLRQAERKFIVIFDNSEASVNLVEEINRRFPKKIVGIYLRQVQNKQLPLGATGFYTAFDIAVKEYKQGRLSKEEVTKVSEVILNQHDIDLIIPGYAMCPSSADPCFMGAMDVKALCTKVRKHLQLICKH